jgi:mannose/fructose-specific phosphotransferase system component IIA
LCIRFCQARVLSSLLRSKQDVADVVAGLPLPEVADALQAVPAVCAAQAAVEQTQQLALVGQDERRMQQEEEAEQQALLDKMAAAEKSKGKKGKKGRK